MPVLNPTYNLSLSTCIANMNTLSTMVLEISLTKSVTELRKDGRTEGRTGVNQYTHHIFKAGVYLRKDHGFGKELCVSLVNVYLFVMCVSFLFLF